MPNHWRRTKTMDDAEFWRLIALLDWKHDGEDDAVTLPVIAALEQRTERDISEFQEILARKLYALDGRAWARSSGSVVWWAEPSSLSVDGFLYSRCTVVANGKAFYDKVLADPGVMPKNVEFESLLYIAREALKNKVGTETGFDTHVSYETFSNESGWKDQP
jgi:hypothetical protein